MRKYQGLTVRALMCVKIQPRDQLAVPPDNVVINSMEPVNSIKCVLANVHSKNPYAG